MSMEPINPLGSASQQELYKVGLLHGFLPEGTKSPTDTGQQYVIREASKKDIKNEKKRYEQWRKGNCQDVISQIFSEYDTNLGKYTEKSGAINDTAQDICDDFFSGEFKAHPINAGRKAFLFCLLTCICLACCAWATWASTSDEEPLNWYGEETKGNMVGPILVGLAGGLVFGFIDNAGLFFGMDYLDKYLPGDNLVKAGLGNTISDAIGAFLGIFVVIISSKLLYYVTNKELNFNDTPILYNACGIITGCLLGIAIPKLMRKVFTNSNKVMLIITLCCIVSIGIYALTMHIMKINERNTKQTIQANTQQTTK